jgi:hypothetical protein
MGINLDDVTADHMNLIKTIQQYADGGQYESKVSIIKVLKDNGVTVSLQKIDELIKVGFLVEGSLDGDPMIEINPDL